MAEATDAATEAATTATDAGSQSLLPAADPAATTDAASGGTKSASTDTDVDDADESGAADQGAEAKLEGASQPGTKADKKLPILGKFADQPALEKAYTELEKKMKEKVPLAPETYDLVEPMKAAGWQPLDPEVPENKKAYEDFTKTLKEQGFSQKQVQFMFEYGKGVLDGQLAQLGPATNKDAESAAIKKEWGAETDAKLKELAAWVPANLNADVVNKPLHATKEGLAFLYDYMTKQRGASPITDAARADAFDPDEAQIAIHEAMKNPEYWKASPTGKALQNKVLNLMKRLPKGK